MLQKMVKTFANWFIWPFYLKIKKLGDNSGWRHDILFMKCILLKYKGFLLIKWMIYEKQWNTYIAFCAFIQNTCVKVTPLSKIVTVLINIQVLISKVKQIFGCTYTNIPNKYCAYIELHTCIRIHVHP